MPCKAAIIIFLTLSVCSGLSESFKGDGHFSSYHDGSISDRAAATGIIEYGAESYDGGFSSGLNVTGSGAYSFLAPDYTISLSRFNGSIIAESDQAGTTVNGFGTGKLETRSYEPGGTIRAFPVGGLNANGTFEIHVGSSPAPVDTSEMNTSVDTEFLRSLI